MNSLANLNSVVDEQGNPTTWPLHGWDPPVTTISTAALPDTRLHFHPSSIPRQDWDWPDNQIILASHQYSPQEHQIECKPNVMQVQALGGGGNAGLRSYSGSFTAADLPAMVTAQNSWPGVFNAATIRQNMGLESSSGSYLPSFYEGLGGGGGNLAGMGAGYGPSASTVNNYVHGIGETRTALEQRHSHLLGLANIDHGRIHDILKRGMYNTSSRSGGTPDFSARIGLNLGGRTYFSTEDSSYTLARFGKRFRPNSPSIHVPLCQAEGCKADLSIPNAKHYHRRHKVCDYHSKAATVIINGNTQRFCQQCSRFHGLSEFDEGKRSCRKRLADHNRRRRKPQSTPATATATPIASSITDSTLKLNDEESKAVGAGRSDEQASGQEQEAAMAASSEQTPSIPSEMSLAPSVSLTLQNGGREMQSMATSENDEKEPAYVSQPYLLNGPSLSLSNIAAVPGRGGTTPSHPQGQSPPQNFGEVELSVPWLRAHHVGSSTRMALTQESLGRSHHQVKEGSMSNSTTRLHANGQYMNEHGRLLAEHMQSLGSQAGSSRDHHHHHHQMHEKTENWVLDNAVVEEGQTVLSLLETASNTKKDHHHHHDHQHHQNHHRAFNAEAENTGSRPSLGFLSPSDMNHDASDAALSLHGMQVLRPLNESLYTTADFMKDGFV